ncbi:universal stress protein [Cupriavidus basilensis]|uniref:Universal stress protein n=1 Tax=Cupriavidus basilensis TaxID=68895 RepID=A0ABT6AL94_9BURK|nr:universal stress protein [Cupriavidus basilensis]MDF3833097.1 universal stress protein [Cupriavidus basilensis]
MDFKTLLVELGSDPGCADRVAFAADLAQRAAGHVIGLTATGMRLEPFRGAGDEAGRYAELARRQLLAQGAEAAAAFQRAMHEAAPGVGFTHRIIEDDAGWALAQQGRMADLVVLARPAGTDGMPVLVAQTAEYVLLNAGRPVLLVPQGVRRLVCQHVAIAWDGGREAARAVADAMPLLRQASRVTVVAASSTHDRTVTHSAPDVHGAHAGLRDQLERQGVAVAMHAVQGSHRVGQLLLEAARHLQVDLLVAGGYGHARLRELVTGGTTRTLMRHADMPVLMSH